MKIMVMDEDAGGAKDEVGSTTLSLVDSFNNG